MNRKSNRLTKAILETTDDMYEVGLISKEDHEKITLRHLKKNNPIKVKPLNSKEIKSIVI